MTKRARVPACGRVVLVGAGPGDPDLLTLRAARALADADLVLYDALVDPRVLALAPTAARFYVGKRRGRHAMAQETIHGLLHRAARRGQTVVRLKSGDPFVLGRGGEEALFCHEAGIACEIVPGVSSAVAAPASIGIPVTHRGVSPGFLVLSAVPATHYETILPSLAPGSITVVLMMALGARRAIAELLLEAAWPSELPAAVVLGATTPAEWSWRGALGELSSMEIPEDRMDLPGVIVLGPAVRISDALGPAVNRSLAEHRSRENPKEATCHPTQAR